MDISFGNKAFPAGGAAPPGRLPGVVGLVGLAGTATALAAFPFSRELAAIGKQTMIVALLFGLAAGGARGLLRKPLFLLFLTWAAYLVVVTLLTSREALWQGHEPWQKTERWLQLGLLPLAAWWIHGRRFGRMLWGLALMGFVAHLLFRAGPEAWADGLSGRRVDFGLNAQHAALYFATLLVLLLGLRREWVARSHRGGRLLLWACWSFLLAAALYGSIVTQTRGIWLALLLAAIAALAARGALGPRSRSSRTAAAPLATALIIGGALALFAPAIVHDRLHGQRQDVRVIEQVVEGDYRRIAAQGSFGIRFHLWQWAAEKWAERPWLGWGVRAVIPLARAEPKPELGGFEHLHNSFLEIAVGTGAIGLALFLAFFGRLTVELWRGVGSGRVQRHEFVLFCALLALVAGANLTEAHIAKHYFWLYLAAVFGPFAALVMGREAGPLPRGGAG